MGKWSPLSASFIRTAKEIVIVQATTNLRLRWQTFACKYYGLQSTQCWSANKLTKAIELNVFLSILSESQAEKIELCTLQCIIYPQGRWIRAKSKCWVKCFCEKSNFFIRSTLLTRGHNWPFRCLDFYLFCLLLYLYLYLWGFQEQDVVVITKPLLALQSFLPHRPSHSKLQRKIREHVTQDSRKRTMDPTLRRKERKKS